MAMNSARQRSKELKSRAMTALSSFPGPLSSPRPSKLVQDHRVRCDELFAFKPVDEEIGCGVKVESSELLGDQVQPLYRTAVIFLVMAHDQLLRHAFDALRITPKRLH